MARKVGKINEIAVDLTSYDYFFNAIGGYGKSTFAYELGKLITKSDEGTFIITCGKEPEPKHIANAFYDVAHDWDELVNIADELCDNKAEYPNTKFVSIDSFDEFKRIAEEQSVKLYNRTVQDVSKRASTIAQAWGGYTRGEQKALELMLNIMDRFKRAGYSRLYIGHTKEKNKKDIYTDTEYSIITNKVEPMYYDSFKDKCNIAFTGYIEYTMTDLETIKDAFTKKEKQVGRIANSKRVLIFRDDENAIDTKCHFKHIEAKIDFSTENFIKAVSDAIKADIEDASGKPINDKEIAKIAKKQEKEKELEVAKNTAVQSNKALLDKIIENKDKLDMVKAKEILDKYGIATLSDENSPSQMYLDIIATLG